MEDKNWMDEIRREKMREYSRNPGLAALMSFFVMGMGQIYAGHVDRGIILLAIYTGGIGAGISIYFKGFIYEWLTPLVEAGLLIPAAYVVSVTFILLWIYNIKDAYYLTLFAGFRDWFEVERLLVPFLEDRKIKLLEEKAPMTTIATTFAVSEGETSSYPTKNDDAEVIDVSIPETRPSDSVTSPKKAKKTRSPEKSFRRRFLKLADGRMKTGISFGLILIFLLLGVWLLRNYSSVETPFSTTSQTSSSALFSLSGDLVPLAEAFPATAAKSLLDHAQPRMSDEDSVVQIPENPFSKGIELIDSGETLEGAKAVEAALEKYPASGEIWKKLIAAYSSSGRQPDYEYAITRYLKSFSDDAPFWVILGKIQFDRKDFIAASRSFNEALNIDAKNVRANYLLGSIYVELGLWDDSIAYLSRALESDPLNPEYNREIASAYLESGKPEMAKKHAERVGKISEIDDQLRDLMERIDHAFYKSRYDYVSASSAGAGSKPGSSSTGTDSEAGVQKKAGAVLYSAPVADAHVTMSMKKTGPAALYTDPSVNTEDPTPMVTDDSDKQITTDDRNPDIEIPEQTELLQNKITASASEDAGELEGPAASQPTDEIAGENSGNEKRKDDKKGENVARKFIQGDIPRDGTGISPNEFQIAYESLSESGPSRQNGELDQDADFSNVVAVETASDSIKETNAGGKKSAAKGTSIIDLKKAGFDCYFRGEWEEALPLFLQYLEHAEDPEIYEISGMIFQKLGMHQEGYEATLRAIRLGRLDSATRARLGRLAFSIGQFEQCEKYVSEILLSQPDRLDLQLLLARSYRKSGKLELAKEQLKKIAENSNASYAIKSRVEKELALINSKHADSVRREKR